jgi:hypothetical protein
VRLQIGFNVIIMVKFRKRKFQPNLLNKIKLVFLSNWHYYYFVLLSKSEILLNRAKIEFGAEYYLTAK